MTTILYDPVLMEQSVRLAVRSDPQAERCLQRDLAPAYATVDEHEREVRFRTAFADWFRRIGLDRFVAGLFEEFPSVGAGVGRVVVRTAARARAECAELLVRDPTSPAGTDQRTLMVYLCPESLFDSERSRALLIRELLHAEDLLDDRFGYRPEPIEGSTARQHLVRDRYRVLWDIHVEARLVRAGRLQADRRDKLRALFDRVLATAGADERIFEWLWNLETITHGELLGWAEDPRTLRETEQSLAEEHLQRPRNGDLCPSCGFPTHDWADFRDPRTGRAADAARSRRPEWRPQDGLCSRCAEALVTG